MATSLSGRPSAGPGGSDRCRLPSSTCPPRPSAHPRIGTPPAPASDGAPGTRRRLVDHVLDRSLDHRCRRGPCRRACDVLDPACGDGRFLAAAARIAGARAPARDRRRASTSSSTGDRRRRGLRCGRRRRARRRRCARPRLGRPSLRRRRRQPAVPQPAGPATTRGGRSVPAAAPTPTRRRSSWRWPLRLARPDGGRVGLVLPQSRARRSRRGRHCATDVLDGGRASTGVVVGRRSVFDADVLTCVDRPSCVARSAGPCGDGRADVRASADRPPADAADRLRRACRPGAHLVADAAGDRRGRDSTRPGRRSPTWPRRRPTSATSTTAWSARSPEDGPTDARSVRWSRAADRRRPLRAGASVRPASPAAASTHPSSTSPALAAGDAWPGGPSARLVPKVLVATQTAVLEAAVDEHGQRGCRRVPGGLGRPRTSRATSGAVARRPLPRR